MATEITPQQRERIIQRIENNLKTEKYIRVGWAVEAEMKFEFRKAPHSILNKVAADLEHTGKYKKERDGDHDWGITFNRDYLEKNEEFRKGVYTSLIGAAVGAILTGLITWILKDNPKQETIVLPEIQIVHDTLVITSPEAAHDTIAENGK